MIPTTKAELIDRFAATWFSMLDLHAPIAECYSMLAEKSLRMHFPDADIRDYASFRKWYGRVTSLFFDEEHTIRSIKILSSSEDRTELVVVVRWQANWWQSPEASSRRIDLEATQSWAVRPCSTTKNAFGLEIVEYQLSQENLKFAPDSAELPPMPSDALQEIIALNERIGEAERKGDAKFLESVLSENLRFRRANGMIVDKAIYLDDLMKPGNTTSELSSLDINPTIHGNLAVVNVLVDIKGMRCGNTLDGVFRNIRIFLNEPAKQPAWQLHFWYNVRIEK